MISDIDILLKNHSSCNLYKSITSQFYSESSQKIKIRFLNLPRANENLEIWMPVLFQQLNESKQF